MSLCIVLAQAFEPQGPTVQTWEFFSRSQIKVINKSTTQLPITARNKKVYILFVMVPKWLEVFGSTKLLNPFCCCVLFALLGTLLGGLKRYPFRMCAATSDEEMPEEPQSSRVARPGNLQLGKETHLIEMIKDTVDGSEILHLVDTV